MTVVGAEFYTFTDAAMVSGLYDLATAQANRQFLENAISGNPGQRVVVGLPGDYYVAQTNDGDSIPLVSNSTVWCLPGCRIIRRHDSFDSGKTGVVSATRDAMNNLITNARWIGGTLVGEPSHPTIDGIPYDLYPEGEVF